MVRALGYQARTARDGREALRYLQQHPGEIRLILTDVVMPYMDGGELAERARDLHPRLPIVLMSAYPVGEIAELVAAYPELPFLEKPFTTETLHKGPAGHGARARGQRPGSLPRPGEAIQLSVDDCTPNLPTLTSTLRR
jgi:CheY-like chemotaxis protein